MEQDQKPNPSISNQPAERGLKIFISGCNSLLGYCLIEELRNDHLEDEEDGKAHLFVGTLSQSDASNPPPANVKRVVSGNSRSVLSKVVQDCDVIVYNLRTDSLDEIRFVTRKFKESNPDTEKVLVLVSSVLYWENTKHTDPLEDKDFLKRVAPLSKIEQKALENEVLAACRQANGNDNGAVHPLKRSYVVCAGLTYGLGEECEEGFQRLFIKAWNCNPGDDLSIINEGTNIIPTVHVKDLAKMIAKVVTAKPDPREHPYLLAVDKAGPTQTQGQIVEGIAKKMGIEKIQKVKYIDIIDDSVKEIVYPLTLNLSMEASGYFKKVMEGEWHAEKGFIANIETVFSELKEARGLRCVKVLLTGPPVAGKTHFAEWFLLLINKDYRLGRTYGIPVLRTKEVVEEAKTMDNPLGEEIRAGLDAIKKKKVEELEAQAKKKKGMEVHPELIIPRLTPEMMWHAYRHKLSQRIYQNKGYILDGYPKTYADACHVFLEFPEQKPEGEEENVNLESLKLDSNAPQRVILFEGTDETLLNRVNAMPEDKRKDTHYTKEGMDRRMQEYKDRNTDPQQNLVGFFQKRGVEILTINADLPEAEQQAVLLDFIEKVLGMQKRENRMES